MAKRYKLTNWKDYTFKDESGNHRIGDCYKIQGVVEYNHWLDGKNIGFINQEYLDKNHKK